jgi:hypothetical protein
MIGSEKQIAWAQTIKVAAIANINSGVLPGAVKGWKHLPPVASVQKVLDWLPKVESARWWIDNRKYLQAKNAKIAIEWLVAMADGEQLQDYLWWCHYQEKATEASAHIEKLKQMVD